MRVEAERDRRAEETAKKAGTAPAKAKKKRGWFG